ENDTSILHIYTQLYDEAALADIRKIAEDAEGVAADLDRLPADAPEEARLPLIARLAKSLARNLMDYPWLNDPASHLAKSRDVTPETMVEAILELYNPAQLDVLGRAHLAAQEQ